MRIPALVLALILPVIMVFSAALVIQAGIRIDSAEDLKTKDYFQTSAFADNFYSKISTILSGISAREILDKQTKMHTLISESFITEILSPSKYLRNWPILSMTLRNGAHRRSIPMMTGSSWALPPRR